MKDILRVTIVAGILSCFAGGCATPAASVKSSPVIGPEQKVLRQTQEGSLWSPQFPLNYCADVKARNVGDIITINIVESAKASKNATTKTSRDSALQASWSGVLEKLTGTWVGADQSASFGTSHDGKGETTRSSFLNAYITAQVVDVMPNKNLLIRGSRQVQVNNENQFIYVEGLVRPEDISSTNIVLSTYIADAKIELTGQGVVSDKQRVGWLTRILDYVWPF
jgi:flagellar L-ring protein FlgH